MKRALRMIGAVIVLSVVASSLWAQEAAPVKRKPVSIEGKSLPLRVLTRPFSNIYKDADPSSAIVQESLPAFQPLFVYTKPPINDTGEAGWYEVGSDNRGTILGWMKGDDVMEWRQAMCLAYTHPEGRSPVLMFKDQQGLSDLVGLSSDERATAAASMYEVIDSKNIPAGFPVVSVEPKRSVFMFIEQQFYLLPILDFQEIELDGREGRLLRMAAATRSERGATTLQNQEYVEQATQETGAQTEKLKNLKMDIVYVIDLTASMQPYIDGTRAAVKSVSESLSQDPALAERVRFGLWGYRDSEEIEGIEFNTRNFTPQLQKVDEFAQTLEGVKEAKVGSKGFEEDLFSGVDKAMRETVWDPEALHMIVLIGDAPAHPLGHKWNASGQSETTLRQFADDNRFSIYSIQIKNPEGKEYFEAAETQYKTLGKNRGVVSEGGSSYASIDTTDTGAFEGASTKLVEVFKETLQQAQQGDVSGIMETAAAPAVEPAPEQPATEAPAVTDAAAEPSATEPSATEAPAAEAVPEEAAAGEAAPVETAAAEAQPVSDTETAEPPKEEVPTAVEAATTQSAKEMVRAALVDWIGQQEGVQAPRDIVAWVTDKDLKDPAVQALEVRVLINKNQLDSMRTVLMEIMAAGRRGQIAGEDFFTALQSTSATLSVTPEQIRNAKTLAQTGLIPEFLVDLPYKSRIMSMNDEVWAGWSQDQQDEFLNEVDAKINLYGAIHDNPEGWVQLNQGDDPDEFVHPINLEALP